MKVIYKYKLSVTDRCVITMPAEAKILTLQMQNGMPHIWAEVNPEDCLVVNVTFRTYGTGYKLFNEDDTCNLEYIGTYQLDSSLVFHVYKEVSV